MLRQVGRRLAHKQWLILYPLALAIVNIVAFLAVYGAAGGELQWNTFIATNYDRWDFIRHHFVSGVSFNSALAVAVFAGLASCVFAAMLRAPLFRAITGTGYPRTPRSWEETGRLSAFYLVFNLLLILLPNALPSGDALQNAVGWIAFLVSIFVVYADYIIVFEGVALIPALRRSARLIAHRWPPVLLGFVILLLLQLGLGRLYSGYYADTEATFILIPVSQVLVWSFVSLLWDCYFIFLYDHVRHTVR